ncbi:transposase [Paenibacillus harenae]|uniref:transposase n=1 Tax=Paenibacillus harenae TaxID=306543 RepID=UPI0006877425|nr:transposase [Paenibacillus harenae]
MANTITTTVTLCLQKFKWAEFRKTKAGIKIHMRLAFVDEQGVIPDKATVTTAKKNDRTQMNELVHEPGVTYIFDRGYIDYAAFDRYCLDDILFVTRLKSNTHMEPLEGCFRALAARYNLDPARDSSIPPQSAHLRLGRFVGDAPGLLARVVRPIANANLWTHTRSAFLSARRF